LWRWPALATLTTFAAAVAPIVTMLAILILGLISWTVHRTAKPGQEPVTRSIQMSLRLSSQTHSSRADERMERLHRALHRLRNVRAVAEFDALYHDAVS